MYTELQAVNDCLSSIGEAPVNSLQVASLSMDAETALQVLRSVSTEVQAKGWWFNRTTVTLNPTADKELLAPNNTLEVHATSNKIGLTADNKIINLENGSASFEQSLEITITSLLPFNELPFHAAAYITKKACRRFQNRVMCSEVIYTYTQEEEVDALIDLERMQLAKEPVSMLTPGTGPGWLTALSSIRR